MLVFSITDEEATDAV